MSTSAAGLPVTGLHMSPTEWGMLVSLSVLWGGSFLFNGILVTELPPLTIVLSRVALASLVLIAVASVAGHSLPGSLRLWGAFFVMGALNNLIPMALIIEAQTQIAGGLAAIMMATTPLFTAVLAHFLTRDPHERLSRNRLIGIVVGLVGVAAIMGPAAFEGFGRSVLAQVAVIGASVSYGFANIFGRNLKGVPSLVAATGQITATAVMMLPVALMLDHPWNLPVPTLRTCAALFGLAILCTALGYILFFAIIRRAGATNVSLVTLLIPVSAIVFGSVILGEHLKPQHFAGMALILAGLICADGRLTVRWASRS
jgi:drug/metabolite transporter (DMT)-like permease